MAQATLIVYFLLLVTWSSCYQARSSPIDVKAVNSRSVGAKQFIWEDSTRIDAYYGDLRKVNAQVWYPSIDDDLMAVHSPYLLFFDKVVNKLNGWSFDDYQSVENIKTNSTINSPIRFTESKLPLILLSPSLGGNLSYYTYYAEQLASQGYVVMGVNHLYESEFVVSSENDVITSNLRFHDSLKTLSIPDQITAERYREVKGVRQKVLGYDLLFSLNQILDEPYFEGVIDHEKIGAFGHSIGGAAVVYLSMIDKRIKAVIDLDGTPPTIAMNNGIDVPFLFIEDLTDYRNHQGYAKLHKRRNDFCELNRAEAWRVLIGGFNHNSFLDSNYYLSESNEEAQEEEYNLNLVLSYIDMFFDAYLVDSNKMKLPSFQSDTLEIFEFAKE